MFVTVITMRMCLAWLCAHDLMRKMMCALCSCAQYNCVCNVLRAKKLIRKT